MKNRFFWVTCFLGFSLIFSDSAIIEGRVTLKGNPLPDQVIVAAKTRDCAHGGEIKTEFWKIGTNSGLGEVVVWIKKIPTEVYSRETITPVIIEQKGCRYVPHISAVLAKEKVKIKNYDATLHNVRGTRLISNRKERVIFNLAQPMQGAVNEVSFSEAGIYSLECDVHPWMQAWVVALENPFFRVTGDSGDFRLPSIPAGEYEVMAWHQKFLKPLSQMIHITSPVSTNKVNFEFVLEEKTKQNR